MKRLIKKATHDVPNRSKAAVYLNGEVKEGFVHSQIISNFEVDDVNAEHELAFAHIVTSDKLSQMKQELVANGISENIISQLFQGWSNGETRVFISTGRELTTDVNKAAMAFKEQLPYDNITVWDDDNYSLEYIGLNIFVQDDDELYDLEIDDLDAFRLSNVQIGPNGEVMVEVYLYQQIL